MNAIFCGVGHNLRKILARSRALLYLFIGAVRAAQRELIDYLVAIRIQQTQFEAA